MAPTPCGARVWRWGRWVDQVTYGRPAGPLSIRALQFNMCGSACSRGDSGRLVTALRDSVLDFEPDVIMLNEACLAQVDRLWDQLDLAEFPTSGSFGATTGRSLCPGVEKERWYGNAVLTRGPGVGQPDLIPLPNRPRLAEKRNVISMTVDLLGIPVLVSCTHLVPRDRDPEFSRMQLTELARVHKARVQAGHPTILGGDFNMTPGRIKALTGAEGRFRDVDTAKPAPTYRRRKIDYILVDTSHFSGLSASVKKSPVSDHRLLKGRATLQNGAW